MTSFAQPPEPANQKSAPGLSQDGRDVIKQMLASDEFEEFMLQTEAEQLEVERDDLEHRQRMLAEARQQKLE